MRGLPFFGERWTSVGEWHYFNDRVGIFSKNVITSYLL